MKNKTQNVLILLHEFQKRKAVNCTQLAGELGVTPRTMYRYLRSLRAAGYKFKSKGGWHGYVELMEMDETEEPER